MMEDDKKDTLVLIIIFLPFFLMFPALIIDAIMGTFWVLVLMLYGLIQVAVYFIWEWWRE